LCRTFRISGRTPARKNGKETEKTFRGEGRNMKEPKKGTVPRKSIRRRPWPERILLLLVGMCSLVFFADGVARSVFAAEEGVPEGMALRWANALYLAVPREWKPVVERDGVGFFKGIHPDVGADGPVMMVMVGLMEAPGEGGYRAFLEDIEKGAKKDNVANFTKREEDITVAGLPALFYSFSGDVRKGEVSRSVEGHLVICKEPWKDDKMADSPPALPGDPPAERFLLVMLGGDAASIEAERETIKRMLGSARRDAPPLREAARMPYGAEGERFRFTFGPAVAADGVLALGDSRAYRVTLFSPDGAVLAEWGSKGEEDGAFSYPSALAFGPDGSVYVADDRSGYTGDVQRFSRDGRLLARVSVGTKLLGEQGINYVTHLGVSESGEIFLAGQNSLGDGNSAGMLRLSPEGNVLSRFQVPQGFRAMTLLPGGKIALAYAPEGDVRAERIAVHAPSGERLAEWSIYGTGTGGEDIDEGVYFRPTFLAGDAEGRIYAFDDAEEALWMYGPDGVFLQVVPLGRNFGIMEGLAATPRGDLILQERPGSMSASPAALVRFENAFPARVPDGGLPSASVSPPVETAPPVAAGGDTPGDSLLEELERLRKALALREEGAAKEKAGDLSGAVELFRKSLALAPDAELEAHLTALEKSRETSPGSAASPAPPLVPADALARYEEGVALQRQGHYYEALLKYRESLAINEDAALADYADSLERLLRERAQTLVTRAVTYQKEGRLEEALAAYRKSLESYPDPRIAAYADKLEAILKARKNP